MVSEKEGERNLQTVHEVVDRGKQFLTVRPNQLARTVLTSLRPP